MVHYDGLVYRLRNGEVSASELTGGSRPDDVCQWHELEFAQEARGLVDTYELDYEQVPYKSGRER